MLLRLRISCVLALFTLSPIFACAGESKSPAGRITIDSSQRFQTIDGFGLNFTAPYFRDDMKPMFNMFIDDLGVTMFRVVPYLVYSNWETTNNNKDPNIMNWEYYDNRYSSPIFEASWKAIRYLNSRGIQPVIALMGPVPSWMLAEQKNPASPINPAMYPDFSNEVVSMLMYARSKEKLKFQYFSPFNETDCYPTEGPNIDPAAAPAVLAAVGSRLRKEGLGDIRLVVPEPCNIDSHYLTPILKNNEVMKQVDAFAFHSYSDSSVAPQVKLVKASAYPYIPVWITEYGDLGDLDKTAENEWKTFSLAVNRRALNFLNQGASALFYFNAYDDYEECTRRLTYNGLFHSADQVYFPRKRYYATRQLYHFVRPGARRIASYSLDEDLTVSAFQNAPSGSLVIVGVKEGGPNHIQVALKGSGPIPDHLDLYFTSRSVNCLKEGTIPVKNGVAELDLPGEAVFTLVGSVGPVLN